MNSTSSLEALIDKEEHTHTLDWLKVIYPADVITRLEPNIFNTDIFPHSQLSIASLLFLICPYYRQSNNSHLAIVKGYELIFNKKASVSSKLVSKNIEIPKNIEESFTIREQVPFSLFLEASKISIPELQIDIVWHETETQEKIDSTMFCLLRDVLKDLFLPLGMGLDVSNPDIASVKREYWNLGNAGCRLGESTILS